MEKIDDLSYSNLVEIIQNDEKIGGEVLHYLANGLLETRREIAEIEKRLISLRNRQDSLLSASRKVVRHLDRDSPLYVKCEDCIIVVTANDLVIENNCI